MINYSYDKTKRLYTFNVWLGDKVANTIRRAGYSPSKQKYLFHKFGPSGFIIHRFFIPDLLAILEFIIHLGPQYDVNLRSMTKLVKLIKSEIVHPAHNNHSLDMDVVSREFKYKPLEVQLPAYDKYAKLMTDSMSRGMLIDGAVGVGKTYVSLSIAEAVHSEVILIVAPLPTITKVWVESISGDDSLFKTPRKVYLVGNSVEYVGEKYVLVHYENLNKVLELRNKFNINFTTLIVDEVHNFNNITASRTKLLMSIIDNIPFDHTLPMSGTPIKASAKDMIPLIKIVSIDFDKHLTRRFIKLYRGASVLMKEVLRGRYEATTVILKKTDMKIPPLSTATIKIKIRNSKYYTLASITKRLKKYVEDRQSILERNYDIYADTYNKLYTLAKSRVLDSDSSKAGEFKSYEDNIKIILKNYKNGSLGGIADIISVANKFEKGTIEPVLTGNDKSLFRDSKTVYKYTSLKVYGEALANIVMRARIDCYSEIAAVINIKKLIETSTKKTIFFSNYISVCDVINQGSIDTGLKPITVYGETSKDLTKNVNIFTHDAETNPLIATYKSLSTGVPLLVANSIVILSMPFRQYLFEQAIGRCWRTGQDRPVTVYVMELDTGDEINITDRDFDIITFFKEEVARLTGKEDDVVIDRSDGVARDLGITSEFYQPVDNYTKRTLNKIRDAISEW